MSIVSPNFPLMLFMIFCFLIVAAIVTGIVLIVVYSMKSAKPRPQVYQNTNPYQNNHYGSNYTGAADSNWNHNHYQPHYMHNDVTNPHHTGYSDVDHDGIPDQYDTHDNRFDNNFSNDSTSSFDNNSWGGDSSSGSTDNSTSSNTDL